MAVNRQALIRAFVRAAKLAATAQSTTVTAIFEGIISGRFTTDVSSKNGGKTIISSTDGATSVSFALVESLNPTEVMVLAEEALEWLLNQPDPNNPRLNPRPTRRVKMSFRRAIL